MGVMSSDVIIDYLLDDRHKFVADLVLDFFWQTLPDFLGLVGHNTSHCSANSIKSVKAAKVSLVCDRGWDGTRLVAGSGIRKAIYCR